MALATIPTPLYPTYSAEFGVSTVGITILFATFSLGAIGGLAVVSSTMGDRLPVTARITAAGLLGAVGAVVLATVPGVQAFAVGRFLCGVGVGVAAANSVAFISTTATRTGRHARVWRALTPSLSMLGLALGPAAAGALVGTGTIERSWLYEAVAAVLIVATAWLATMPRAASSARSKVTTDVDAEEPPRAFWPYRLKALVAFSVTGLFGALTSHLLDRTTSEPSAVTVGVVAAVPFLCGAIAAAFAPKHGTWQTPSALAGVVLVGVSHAARIDGLFILGAAVAGFSAGALFGSALHRALSDARLGQHARAATDCFIWAYLGLSFPVVAVGTLIEFIPIPMVLATFTAVLAAVMSLLHLQGRREGRSSD